MSALRNCQGGAAVADAGLLVVFSDAHNVRDRKGGRRGVEVDLTCGHDALSASRNDINHITVPLGALQSWPL